jgi:hypothetical protein
MLGLRLSLIVTTAATAIKQQEEQQQQRIPDECYHTVLFNPVHVIT